MKQKVSLVIADFIDALPSQLRPYREMALNAVTRLFEDSARRTPEGQVYLSTGDIPAMWLRDSSFQIKPLIRFSKDSEVYEFCAAVIARQAFYIAIDPYANAFNPEPDGNCWHRDFADQSPWVFERKWEIDSLASFLDISANLAEVSGRTDHFDESWRKAADLVLETFEREQRHEPNSYRFVRTNAPAHDFLSNEGLGEPYAVTGMIWSAFRPSDDACSLPFNIPQNAYAAASLRRAASLLSGVRAEQARRIASEIEAAIVSHGLRDGSFLYEVDGLGNSIFMDDANYPSLLSLPYLCFCDADDARYLATRSKVLSAKNSWFFEGPLVAHVGSPHTGKDRIWPLAVSMEILTSSSARPELLELLAQTASPHGALHESVSTSDFGDFTREWFSWAEMAFFDALCHTAELDAAQTAR